MSPMLNLDPILASHCGPALAGIKPSNLVNCVNSKFPDLEAAVAYYNQRLNHRDIFFRILCRCNKNSLLFVYRKGKLEDYLFQKAHMAFLEAAGYPPVRHLPLLLAHLGHKLSCYEDFPHEVGLFLGYPYEDVIGFQMNKGKNFKHSGIWKVYGDPEEAEALFNRYDKCAKALKRRVDEGVTIVRLFNPAV